MNEDLIILEELLSDAALIDAMDAEEAGVIDHETYMNTLAWSVVAGFAAEAIEAGEW